MNKIIRFIPYCLIALTLSLVVIPTSARRDPPNGAPKDSTVVFGEVSPAKVQDTQISTRLRRYDLVRLDARAAASQIRRNGKLFLNTSFGSFNLDLQPHDLRAPDYASQWIDSEHVAHQLPKEPITTFKGTLLGMLGQARMTVTETDVEGVLIAGNERYFIEPARKLSKTRSADEFIFYRATDLIPDTDTCGVTLADEIAAEEERARTHIADEQTPKSLVIPGVSPVRIVRLATDADAEFVAALGGAAAANTQIMNIMNQVDGIYQVEMGVGFQIVFQNAWADAGTQPYNTLLPSDLLTQFRNHWNANFGSVSRNLTHLWTGKDLNGGTIGIAYLGVVCQSSTFSYGLSQRFPSAGGITVQTVSLTAHEIGHNFSARHTNQPGSELPRDVEIGCQSTIMEASIGSGSAFCPYSQSQIIGHASNASCLLDSGNPPPSTTPCIETPIAGAVNATLDASDCRSPARGVGFFADRFSFNATAGDQITITMTRSGTSLDPYLFLIGPTGMVLIQNDDSGGGQNSRIPSSSELTLPHTGKYIIEATSFAMNQTGGYTVALTFNGCRLSVSPSSIQVSAAGGPGSINVGNCGSYQLRGYSTGNWLIESITGGSGTQTLNYSVQPNPNAAGRTGFLVVGGDNGVGGLRIPVHQSGSGPDCTTGTIGFGQTINGSIVPGDCHSPVRGNNYFSKRYTFTATEGQQAAITLTGGFDTFLTLIGPDGAVLLNDDDSGGGTSSRIPGGPGFFRLGVAGTYVIEVNGFSAGTTGPFTLTLTGAQSAAQLGSATYNVNENVGSVNVTVNRSGDLTSAAAVDFSTGGSGFQACSVLNGAAVQNCDYIVGA
ncbi:MAG TPA: M12 family metallo-peptidase, partial [Pyrinomonadaceae bacterium]